MSQRGVCEYDGEREVCVAVKEGGVVSETCELRGGVLVKRGGGAWKRGKRKRVESAPLGDCVEEGEGGNGEGLADVVESNRGVGGSCERARRRGRMDAVVE